MGEERLTGISKKKIALHVDKVSPSNISHTYFKCVVHSSKYMSLCSCS